MLAAVLSLWLAPMPALAQDAAVAPEVTRDSKLCRLHASRRLVTAVPLGSPAPNTRGGCLYAALDLAGRGSIRLPEEGISRQISLKRGRAELGIHGPGPVTARIAWIATRPDPGDGTTGAPIVPKFQIAEARVDWHQAGLAVAAGMVDDIWVMGLQTRWQLIFIANPMSTDQRWFDRSDLGAWLSWTAPKGFATLTASVTTGEGADQPERNNGKNVTVVATARPFASKNRAPDLELAAFVRNGSRGADGASDHRAGGRVDVQHPWIGGGVETIWGWGHDGDAALRPGGVSIWSRTGHASPMLAWARLDLTWADRDSPDTRATIWRVGMGPLLPWTRTIRQTKPIYAVVGYEGVARANAAEGGVGTTSHLIFLQLGVVLDGRVLAFHTGGAEP